MTLSSSIRALQLRWLLRVWRCTRVRMLAGQQTREWVVRIIEQDTRLLWVLVGQWMRSRSPEFAFIVLQILMRLPATMEPEIASIVLPTPLLREHPHWRSRTLVYLHVLQMTFHIPINDGRFFP